VADALLGKVPLAQLAVSNQKPRRKFKERVSVVPLFGTITYRPSLFSQYGAGTSIQEFLMYLNLAASISETVVIDVDTPGGSVAGLTEAADAIYRLRQRKPVIAISNTLAASAGYFLASQASRVVASPSSYTGSVGTILIHADESRMWDGKGVTFTTITAGKDKALGSELEPLEDEGRRYLQGLVDSAYADFTRAVARGRNVPVREVRGPRFGEGRVLTATEAKRAGMVDAIATFDSIVGELQEGGEKAFAEMESRWTKRRIEQLAHRSWVARQKIRGREIAARVGRR
jgi:signal peptide peptidase SppA